MDEFDLDGDVFTADSATDATHPPVATPPNPATDPAGGIPSPFSSRMSQRARALRLAGISILLVLALAIPLASLPPGRRLVTNLLYPATPTATPLYLPGVQPIAYSNSVPWGVLRIDGHAGVKLTGVAVRSGDTYFQPVFKVGQGQHTIMYDAPPYPPLRCTLSVPAASSDTCPPGGGRGLDLQATPEHLSAPLANALKLAVQTALDTTLAGGAGAAVTVEAGERYVAADGRPLTATAPLQAHLLYLLNADATLPLPAGSTAPLQCITLCIVPNVSVVRASPSQIIGANVVVSWQYRSSDGQQMVLDHAPAAPAHQDQTLVLLHVRWGGDHWLAEVDDSGDTFAASVMQAQPVCQIAGQLLGPLLTHHPALGQRWGLPPSPWPAAGCIMFTTDLAGTPLPAESRLLLLFRFGVLLAVNDATHQAFPDIPVATPAEQALAHQFANG